MEAKADKRAEMGNFYGSLMNARHLHFIADLSFNVFVSIYFEIRMIFLSHASSFAFYFFKFLI